MRWTKIEIKCKQSTKEILFFSKNLKPLNTLRFWKKSVRDKVWGKRQRREWRESRTRKEKWTP